MTTNVVLELCGECQEAQEGILEALQRDVEFGLTVKITKVWGLEGVLEVEVTDDRSDS